MASLVIADDFTAPFLADYGRETYGVGPVPAIHPLGGEETDLTAVDLTEELIGLAVRTGAEIEISHTSVPVAERAAPDIPAAGTLPPRSEAATVLNQYGGVGAFLRFSVPPA